MCSVTLYEVLVLVDSTCPILSMSILSLISLFEALTSSSNRNKDTLTDYCTICTSSARTGAGGYVHIVCGRLKTWQMDVKMNCSCSTVSFLDEDTVTTSGVGMNALHCVGFFVASDNWNLTYRDPLLCYALLCYAMLCSALFCFVPLSYNDDFVLNPIFSFPLFI